MKLILVEGVIAKKIFSHFITVTLAFSLISVGIVEPSYASETNSEDNVNEVNEIAALLSSVATDENIAFNSTEDAVTISDDPSEGVVMSTETGDIGLSLPVDEGATYEILETGDVAVSGEDEETELLVQDFTPVELQDSMDGIRVIASIENREADPLLEFGLDIPEGGRVVFHDDGTVEVLDGSDNFVGAIGPAWAVDAQGNEVPTWYEYEDGKFYQYIDHLSADYAYPITADPAFLVPLLVNGGRIIFQRVVAPALVQAGRIAVQQLAKKGIRSAVTGLKSYIQSNARHNLIIFRSYNPGSRCDAHHTLPVKFESRFRAAGFTGGDTIHHPKYILWWEKHDHRSKAYRVNQAWQNWFNKNARPSKKAVLNQRTAILRQCPPRC